MNWVLKFDKRLGVLIAALLFGISGAIGSYYLLNQRIDEIKHKAAATVAVVVARDELAEGSVLTSQTLSSREIPEEWVQSGAVRTEEYPGIENARLKGTLAKGEMVMWSMVERPEERVISGVVAKGRRAVTVPVDEIASLSGMLQPGDLIDLIVTVDQQESPVSFPVMQHARIIATGARLQGVQQGEDTEHGAGGTYTTITLDATPEEARRIIAARDGGRLTAMLRNPDDHQSISDYRLSLEDMSFTGGMRPSAGHRRSSVTITSQAVRIVYGDQP